MTYFKECPECGNKCYSASWRGSWECPHCERNLDDVEAQSIAELENRDNSKNHAEELESTEKSSQKNTEVNTLE